MELDEKRMPLRYAGICRVCGQPLAAGARAIYERSLKSVRCLTCAPAGAVDQGTPGEPAGGHSVEVQTPRRVANDSQDALAQPSDGAHLVNAGPVGLDFAAPTAPPGIQFAPPNPADEQAMPNFQGPPGFQVDAPPIGVAFGSPELQPVFDEQFVVPSRSASTPPERFEPTAGVAGASARREYERRRAREKERLRENLGMLGVVLSPFMTNQSTTAWAAGAKGERLLGGMFDRLVSPTLAVLHDRQIPGSRANIDHLIVTPSGIWVVDAKRYKGRVELKVFGFGKNQRRQLVVNGRDKTKLVEGMHKQLAVVRGVVGFIPVRGVLCFVESEWKLGENGFRVDDDVVALTPRRLKKLLLRSGGDVDMRAARDTLLEAFPTA